MFWYICKIINVRIHFVVDTNQLASVEASKSGSTLFSIEGNELRYGHCVLIRTIIVVKNHKCRTRKIKHAFTLCMLGNFSHFCRLLTLFQNQLFGKILSGTLSECHCQRVWIQIGSDFLSGPNCLPLRLSADDKSRAWQGVSYGNYIRIYMLHCMTLKVILG